MRRFVWISGAIILAALAVVALAVLLIPRERLRTHIAEQVAAWTGRDVTLSGTPRIDLFPRLTVTLSDVAISGPRSMADAEILSMKELVGEVRLLPLLIGQVEIGSFTLVEPHIRLVRDTSGRRNWDFDSGAAALQLAFAGDVPLGEFKVTGGTLDYENRQAGISEEFEAVELLVDWTSVRHPLAVSGSARWRGERVAIEASAEAPFAFINRRTTPLEASFSSGPLSFTLDGGASGLAEPQIAGRLEATTPSFRRFLQWMGNPIGEGATLAAASLAGQATFSGDTLSVEQAELRLDDNRATGALSLSRRDRPFVSGTLAFETLRLAPYFAGIGADLAARGDWRAVDFDTDWIGTFGADIRLSAAEVDSGPVVLGRTAATVSIAGSRLELGLAEGEIYGGDVTGSVAVEDRTQQSEFGVDAELRASGIDLAAASAGLGLPAMTGVAALSLDLKGSGASLGGVYEGLEGTGRASVSRGSAPAIGLTATAAAIRAGDPAIRVDPAARLAFESIDATLELAGGQAGVESAMVRAADFEAELSGAIGLADGALDLQGVIELPDVGAPVPFEIEGTLAGPRPRLAPLAN